MSETDIVIVGGGVAGLTAANRAAQLGLKALVLEKGTEDKYLCNTRYTGGTLHVCMSDIMSGEDALLEKIQSICADVARPDLARAIAKAFARVLVRVVVVASRDVMRRRPPAEQALALHRERHLRPNTRAVTP